MLPIPLRNDIYSLSESGFTLNNTMWCGSDNVPGPDRGLKKEATHLHMLGIQPPSCKEAGLETGGNEAPNEENKGMPSCAGSPVPAEL